MDAAVVAVLIKVEVQIAHERRVLALRLLRLVAEVDGVLRAGHRSENSKIFSAAPELFSRAAGAELTGYG